MEVVLVIIMQQKFWKHEKQSVIRVNIVEKLQKLHSYVVPAARKHPNRMTRFPRPNTGGNDMSVTLYAEKVSIMKVHETFLLFHGPLLFSHG